MTRNVFGVNLTKGQESRGMDGDVFIARTISSAEEKELDKIQDIHQKLLAKRKLPLVLEVLRYICILIGVVFFSSALPDEGVGLREGYHEDPGSYWIFSICFVIAILLALIGKLRAKRVVNSKEFRENMENYQRALQNALQTLQIPENAKQIDVLGELYTLKKGKIKHKSGRLAGCVNCAMKIYEREGMLCLADLGAVWEIPIVSLRAIALEKKRVSFMEWHKEQPHNSKQYKKYRITSNQYGVLSARCYRIEIRDTLGDFYLLIPEYDGETFMDIMHLHPRG